MSEYADSGTLWDLFLEGIPPYRAEMPGSYGKAFQGLLTNFRSSPISTMQIVIRAYLKYGSVHQDLKPSNLFMFKSKQNDNKYAYKIKIGDFGASYAQSTLQGPYGPDRGGSREYSPPELFFNDTVDYKASAADDIWAFGCIIVETAVWIALGQDGRQAFRIARKKETQSLANHEQLGRSDCFHDGMAALNCARGIPKFITDRCRYSDTITPRMVNLALDHALIDACKRARAGQLLHRINDILRDIQASPVSPMSTHPISPVSPPQPPHSVTFEAEPLAIGRELTWASQPQSDSSWNHASDSIPIRDVTGPSSPSVMTSSLPYVSIQELEKWVKEKKNKNINDLPGWNAAQSLLAKREIRHSEEVKNSVAAFSYLFKTLDPNGIDVVMASAPHIKVTKKTSTDIKNFVGTEFAAGKLADCFIEMALDATLDPIKEIWSHNRRNSTILDNFRSPYASSMKSVSVFVFTNGVWDHGKDETSGASTAIQSLIAVMKEHRIDRTNASIQFVRFGESEVGIRRLEILDDELLDADGNEFGP
ncbi:hypothetical protein SUNI508_08086 [Seiridium unicorne]|uniref:non-specific serine/threonine protein kinase n=1 Tax=Seiridium unicorne TaxID=138068 RepID=A0ABR2UUX7_9PEZI